MLTSERSRDIQKSGDQKKVEVWKGQKRRTCVSIGSGRVFTPVERSFSRGVGVGPKKEMPFAAHGGVRAGTAQLL